MYNPGALRNSLSFDSDPFFSLPSVLIRKEEGEERDYRKECPRKEERARRRETLLPVDDDWDSETVDEGGGDRRPQDHRNQHRKNDPHALELAPARFRIEFLGPDGEGLHLDQIPRPCKHDAGNQGGKIDFPEEEYQNQTANIDCNRCEEEGKNAVFVDEISSGNRREHGNKEASSLNDSGKVLTVPQNIDKIIGNVDEKDIEAHEKDRHHHKTKRVPAFSGHREN